MSEAAVWAERWSEYVHMRRRVLGLSNGQLAKRAAVARGNVSRAQKGLHVPTLDVIVRFARALNDDPVRVVRFVLTGAFDTERPHK